ncbi:hypothetical protein V1J52_16020 [Streptomyces sp. TRM 70351]|uniref:hypothetical protein n=1 Tax=Streptomyces sp. TRM 70351 TaxID=3116552 RepID=UPI002E7C1E14|nr:hypothetical protein [Streptomyces sp. TRM 70351]MEE1929674.1 hypothetical protein [Streptomyces sp. TRM 70351]
MKARRDRRPAGDAAPPSRWAAARRRLTAAGVRCGRTARDAARWVSRRRRVAADQFLRGACYGAGTAVTGLLVVWARTR